MDNSNQQGGERAFLDGGPAEQNEQLRIVKDTSPVWLWEQDEEFRYTVDLRGRDVEPRGGSIIGRRRWESSASVPLVGTWDDHRRHLEARKPFRDFEFRVGEDPGALYISTTGVPVYDREGRFTGYRGTAMDVTALKNAQRDAEKAQSLLKLASRLGRVGAWSVELQGLRVDWSSDALELLAFPPHACPGVRDVLALVHRRQQRDVYRAWLACLETGLSFDLEVRIFTHTGRPMWMRVLGEPARAEDGTIVRIQGAAQDITSSKEDRERLRGLGEQLSGRNLELAERVRDGMRELELVNADLRDFAHALAHDLRAPIAATRGFSDALEAAVAKADMARAAHFAGRIKAASHRMDDYVDALLSLAQTSGSVISLSEVDLSSLAASVIDELQARDSTRQVACTITPGMWVRGDSRLLRMLLENLLGNAWKFTARRAPAQISFTCSAGETAATIYCVADNGAGFDMKWAGKLFGTFQRLHAADEYEGTGIGLANASRIVSRHGGRIWAESSVDAGARFSFTLAPDSAPGMRNAVR